MAPVAYDRRMLAWDLTPRRVLRWAYRLVAALLSLGALAGTVRLVVPATAGTAGEPPGVRRQLAFVRAELDAGAAQAAQNLFPEGYFFFYELYGLAWVELGQRAPVGSPDRVRALRAARWALSHVDSPAGRAPFAAELAPSYGVFYRGWTTWLRAGVLSLQPPGGRDPDESRTLAEDCAALGAAFEASLAGSSTAGSGSVGSGSAGSGSPYLAAYPGQAWPVDSTVAIAALRMHDTLLAPRFAGTVARWLTAVRQRLDPATGLLPHRVDLATGTPTELARGGSQSVIQRFLVEVDPGFAREQYLRFRELFLARPLGLGPAVREYPTGHSGPSDVDSGPLPLGISLSATVVTLGAAQVQGDTALAGALANYGELVGLPLETPWTKRYALGALPIGDVFLAWAKTARPWVAPAQPAPRAVAAAQPAPGAALPPPGAGLGWWWRLPLLAILAVAGALGWLPAGLSRYRRRRQLRRA